MKQIQINETYANSEAALAHHGGCNTNNISKDFEYPKITRFDVYGEPGEELKNSQVWVHRLTIHSLDSAVTSLPQRAIASGQST